MAVLVPSVDLAGDVSLLESAGFRLNTIFPADDPRVAEMSGHEVVLRLDTTSNALAPTIQIAGLDTDLATSAGATLTSGQPDFTTPALDDAYVYSDGGVWGEGRAGMQYRDLIPDRHGGRVIASHIRIAEPGPVPDYVHHHDIRFQMIYCRRGSVEVIYEDQGDAFWMHEGDCVLQPPHIRHRVLASNGGCEVVEIASPAEHPTFIDHNLTLPSTEFRPDRDFGGQRFSFDRNDDIAWQSLPDGWSQRVNGIHAATDGLANVRLLRPGADGSTVSGAHDGDLCLFFVLEGTTQLEVGSDVQRLTQDDSAAIPRRTPWRLSNASANFSALHVAISGDQT